MQLARFLELLDEGRRATVNTTNSNHAPPGGHMFDTEMSTVFQQGLRQWDTPPADKRGGPAETEPRVFQVGDRVTDRKAATEYTVVGTREDGRLRLTNGNSWVTLPESRVRLVKPARPVSGAGPLPVRVDALEARASRHVFHLTRVAGVVEQVAARVTDLENEVAELRALLSERGDGVRDE